MKGTEVCKVEVLNCSLDSDRYIVARLNMNQLWYWGSWPTKEAAQRVADTFDNAIVLERCKE